MKITGRGNWEIRDEELRFKKMRLDEETSHDDEDSSLQDNGKE